MNNEQQWIDLENRSADWLDAMFRAQIGLDTDPLKIKRYSEAIILLAENMAPSYRDHPDAWSLLSRIIMDAKLTMMELEIRKLSEKFYTFDDILVDDQPVTPYSRARYLRNESNPEKRHEILSRIARGHPEVDRALEQHNARKTILAKRWKYTPIDDFLISEGLELDQLRKLLMGIATAMRSSFQSRFAENREAVLGNNQGEPWEDFTTLYLNRWSEYADRFIPAIDATNAALKTANTMGFEVDAITIDLEDRPRKIPGASAWDVRIPSDVRVCVKPVSGVTNFTALYHEMGHALHFVSINPTLPYFIRSGYSFGIAETFSFWMESLISDPVYLKELGINERASKEFIRFEQFIRATFSTWLPAQALCIIDYWEKGPFTLEEIGENLGNYMQQFMGFSVPTNAIRVLPAFARTLNMNTLGYPVAYARLGHLLEQLESEQRDWWQSSTTVDLIRNFMRGGRKAGFPSSMLDINPFIHRYVSGMF